jgi:hypothetical protein
MPSGRLRKYGRGAAEQPAGDRADKGLATQKAGDAPPVPPSVIPDNSQFLQGDFASVKGGPKGGSQHAGAPDGGSGGGSMPGSVPLQGRKFMDNPAQDKSPQRGPGKKTPDAKTMIRKGMD